MRWIDTPSPAHRRIETLHNGQRESTPFQCAGRPDRDPRPAPSRGSTPFGPLLPDRDPSQRTTRIDTFPMRRSPGSRPSTGSTSRIDTLRPTTAGSRPFTPDSTDRHLSHAPDARIETLDRLHLADRHPSAHHCRIEAVHTGWRGSTPFGSPLPDRDPSQRTARIDTLPHAPDARIETPDRLHTADRHPSAHHCRIETLHAGRRGSTPFPCAGRLDRDP